MECRKLQLQLKYGEKDVEIWTNNVIPCPVCNVIHTPEGDRQIQIIKGDEENEIIH